MSNLEIPYKMLESYLSRGKGREQQLWQMNVKHSWAGKKRFCKVICFGYKAAVGAAAVALWALMRARQLGKEAERGTERALVVPWEELGGSWCPALAEKGRFCFPIGHRVQRSTAVGLPSFTIFVTPLPLATIRD